MAKTKKTTVEESTLADVIRNDGRRGGIRRGAGGIAEWGPISDQFSSVADDPQPK